MSLSVASATLKVGGVALGSVGTTVNVEAGVDREEDRVNAVIDRVNTTATVWLGTTLACAQCHNHPFDRWTMNDYYSFAAFFCQIGRKNGEDYRETISQA